MRWVFCLLLLAGCTAPQREEGEERQEREERSESDVVAVTTSITLTPRRRFMRRRLPRKEAERAWVRTLLRNERAVWPGQAKEMFQVGLHAPASKNILFESGHSFMFILSSEEGREVDIEIRVVNTKTGELLTLPGFVSHLYGIRGHALLNVPIWRGGIIPAGDTMQISVQIYIATGEAPTKIGVALLMVEFFTEVAPVATRESDREVW